MPVDVEISRQHLREELALFEELAATYGWDVVADYARLTVRVTMRAHNGDPFIVEIRCDDYKQAPPFFEFIDPDTGEAGTRHAYPKGTDSFFNEGGPFICAPFNRNAYQSVVPGRHGDWNLGEWQNTTANNTSWGNYSKLGDMLGAIHTRLSRPDLYKGRMA